MPRLRFKTSSSTFPLNVGFLYICSYQRQSSHLSLSLRNYPWSVSLRIRRSQVILSHLKGDKGTTVNPTTENRTQFLLFPFTRNGELHPDLRLVGLSVTHQVPRQGWPPTRTAGWESGLWTFLHVRVPTVNLPSIVSLVRPHPKRLSLSGGRWRSSTTAAHSSTLDPSPLSSSVKDETCIFSTRRGQTSPP